MVRTVAAGGLTAQAIVLAVLATTVGLGPAGWLAGVVCGVATNAVLARGLTRSGRTGPGPADWVTLTRATLVGGVTALVVQSFSRTTPVALTVTLASVALVLDALDGRVARRTGTASLLGARFDMEVDAFLILVLSVAVAPSLGTWVLAIGWARYVFVAAGWLLPWLTVPTPPRYWCKVVAAIQAIVLTVAIAGVLPAAWNEIALASALALLAESFGRDVWWLSSRHRLQQRPGRRRALVKAVSR
jgi:phosphatidylglycerophosphate synthase